MNMKIQISRECLAINTIVPKCVIRTENFVVDVRYGNEHNKKRKEKMSINILMLMWKWDEWKLFVYSFRTPHVYFVWYEISLRICGLIFLTGCLLSRGLIIEYFLFQSVMIINIEIVWFWTDYWKLGRLWSFMKLVRLLVLLVRGQESA
jgi:hypothetical protein